MFDANIYPAPSGTTKADADDLSGDLPEASVDETFEISFSVPTVGPLPSRIVRRVLCARVPITLCSPSEAIDEVLYLASGSRSRGADVHLCNAYTLALADRDSQYRETLSRATLNLADGKSVTWANRLAGHRDRASDRIRGNDLFLDVVDRGRAKDVKHYLLGGTEETVERLAATLKGRFPTVAIVGVESPPFRELTEVERSDQVQRIVDSGADVVWVGLGTPKQDIAVVELARDTGAVAVAIGAAFDFISGGKPEAPRWMQESGLEWLHRFGTEPRRLWRRYLFGNSRFIYAALRHRRAGITAGAKADEMSSPS